MSIASTKLSMGYVGFTGAADNCGCCFHAHVVDVSTRTAGQVRCVRGAFFTTTKATCSMFQPRVTRPAGEARIQIGPTDV